MITDYGLCHIAAKIHKGMAISLTRNTDGQFSVTHLTASAPEGGLSGVACHDLSPGVKHLERVGDCVRYRKAAHPENV